MEWVETTGPTIEAARDAALDQLGVDERDAELVVVAEPRSGLFGFGKVEARVRARVRPAPPRPKRPARRRGAEERTRSRGPRGAEAVGAGGTQSAAPEEPRPSGRRQRARPGGADDQVEARDASPASDRSAGEGAAGGRRGGGATRDRQGGATGSGRRRAGEDGPERATRVNEAGATVEETEMTIEEQASLVEQFVTGVVERFGYDQATTTVRVDEDHILVDVTGDELGLLIGPRGRTLDALQELARTVVQRRGEEGGTRVVVDVAGFRAKRTAALEAFVRRVADQVVERGESQALEAMSAADRKVVHDAITGIDGVTTSSEGVEPNRYVVLHPAGPAAGSEPAEVGTADEAADDA
jgi:spoIIIJ-associated protein